MTQQKKNQLRLRRRMETMVSESPELRVEVCCKQTRLYVPPDPDKGPLGGVQAVVEAVAPYLPDVYQSAVNETFEAMYTITIQSPKREQSIELTAPELGRVLRTVAKVMPGSGLPAGLGMSLEADELDDTGLDDDPESSGSFT